MGAAVGMAGAKTSVPGTAKTPADRAAGVSGDGVACFGGLAACWRAETTTAATKGAARNPPAATMIRPRAKRTTCKAFDMVSTAGKGEHAAGRTDRHSEHCRRRGDETTAWQGPAAIQLCAMLRPAGPASIIFHRPDTGRLTGTVSPTGTRFSRRNGEELIL